MSENEEFLGFRINKSYADNYNKWRQQEELQKLKDKYGNFDSIDNISSSETEDEDAEFLTTDLEKGWLRAYAAIKSKDPKIYDKKTTFYNDDDDPGEGTSSAQSKRGKDKPMFLKDYDRKVLLEKGGVVSDGSDEDEDRNRRKNDPSYVEEQQNIKESLKAVLPDSDSEEEFLSKRNRTKEEKVKEEEDYLEWLKGQKEEIEDTRVGTDLKPLKKYWTDPSLDEGEKFLKNYILNKEYLGENEERIPTYHEIVDDIMSDDEAEVDKQEEFERKYNFRFEEPDAELIKTYPRTIGESVRKKKEKRPKKRKEIKLRKEQEKEKKMEELKQLKNLKKKEIFDKLDRIKEITGNANVGFTEEDMEGDFDPSEHDKMMKQAFSEGYYDMEDDNKKPVFSEDEDLLLQEENWDDWQGPSSQGGDAEGGWEDEGAEWDDAVEGEFNMDADYDPSQEDRTYGLDGRSKKKKKSKFLQAVERKKPVFDPNEKSFEEYFEEYYKLDYEDIIGDQPCRFKYRSVPANDFGLTADEILTAREQELNAWVSLKRMSQYRTAEEEEFDKKIFSRKARNEKKKYTVLPSLKESNQDEGETDEVKSKKKQKRKRKKTSAVDPEDHPQPGPKNTQPQSASPKQKTVSYSSDKPPHKKHKPSSDVDKRKTDSPGKKNPESKPETMERSVESPRKSVGPKKKNKKKKQKEKTKWVGMHSKGFKVSEDRLKAYGIDPKKFKYTYKEKLKLGEKPS